LGIGLQKYVFAVENKISRHQTLFRIGEERVILKINYKAETLTWRLRSLPGFIAKFFFFAPQEKHAISGITRLSNLLTND
jgi:hypothetical protein